VDGTLLDRSEPRIRDRCPGVIELHRAADGMLARLRVPGGRLSAAQLVAIAEFALQGNGIIELTSRANVQARGLAEQGSEQFAPSLAAVGLLPSREHERVRNILASPLADRHPAALLSVDEIVGELDRGLCTDPELADLLGRVLFMVEDGSGVLAGLAHDFALAPAPSGGAALLVDGEDSGLRASGSRAAACLVLRAARAFLAAARVHSGGWSVRELPGGAAEVIGRIAGAGAEAAGETVCWPAVAPRPLAPGVTRQGDGRIALTALAPLGRLSEVQLRALADIAAEVRVSPWRTVTVLDLSDAEASGVQRVLSDLGLVVEADSGWAGLSACAGLGACASARADVRAAATARAAVRVPGAPAEHWAACPRRCGERPGMPVAVAVLDAGIGVRRAANEVLADDVQAALDLLGGCS
jgi:sulfite reductase beta subunit-like hemoprotein